MIIKMLTFKATLTNIKTLNDQVFVLYNTEYLICILQLILMHVITIV